MKELITLETIPDGMYLELLNEDNQKLWDGLTKIGTVQKISEIANVSIRNLYKYKEGNSGYPSKVMLEILRLGKMEIENVAIKTQRNSKRIRLKLPVYITEEFAEFLGHLLGDGGIDHQFSVHYTTDDANNARRFDELVSKIFGQTEHKEYNNGKKITLYYPKTIGVLLSKVVGIPNKSKVETNACIPERILPDLTDEMKKEFVKAFYLCDGEKDYVRIAQASKSLTDPPKRLSQIKNFLEDIGYKSVIIKKSATYRIKNGIRKRWILRFSNKEEREEFKVFVADYREQSVNAKAGLTGSCKARVPAAKA